MTHLLKTPARMYTVCSTFRRYFAWDSNRACGAQHLCFCRGYLAKGVLLREEGQRGDAQRMFLQARYIAPPNARAVIDRVIGRDSIS